MAIIQHLFYEGGSLPFSIIIVIDNSGSLTSGDVPAVFAAIDDIKADLVSLGTLTEGQADQFVPIAEPTNERYLSWFATYPDTIGSVSEKSVVIVFQDEASTYHTGIGTFQGNPNYSGDLSAFTFFMANESSSELLGGKIFVPQDSASVYDDPNGPFIVPENFDIHLEYVFLDPSAGGYPTPSLSSFVDEEGSQVLSYEVLEGRYSPTFTENYIYNKMAEYLNTYFTAEGFSTLTLR